ncbi:PREDICTED: uncharacterized protein LOC106148572 [Chinchilla lanigera]|uniref:uncharacterized protein LOC106148572 n=1 Tax=Chinchilla lanigera TaxID=34839 RepID=UPI00069849C3|nr:PREDICTED: uncharacterized protein LOC106148572 [Chinchilla lanigera]
MRKPQYYAMFIERQATEEISKEDAIPSACPSRRSPQSQHALHTLHTPVRAPLGTERRVPVRSPARPPGTAGGVRAPPAPRALRAGRRYRSVYIRVRARRGPGPNASRCRAARSPAPGRAGDSSRGRRAGEWARRGLRCAVFHVYGLLRADPRRHPLAEAAWVVICAWSWFVAPLPVVVFGTFAPASPDEAGLWFCVLCEVLVRFLCHDPSPTKYPYPEGGTNAKGLLELRKPGLNPEEMGEGGRGPGASPPD